MIEDGVKVETDTTRTMSEASFDSAWSDDDDETPDQPAAAEPVAEPTAETPTPDPVAELPVASDAALPEGYKLDALGRVHGPDGRVVSREEAEKLKAQAVPATPATPDATAPQQPAVVAEAPKAPVAPEPFTFRANGQKHTIPGLVVPPEQQELVRNLLVAGVNHNQNFPRMQAEWKQKLAQAEHLATAKSDKYNKASLFLWERVEALLAENPAELEMTRRELALALKEADLSIPRAAAAEPAQPDPQQLEQAARQTLAGYVQELFEDTPDAAKYLSADERKDLLDAMQSLLPAYFDEQDGQILLDTHKAKAHFDRELRIAQRAHQARETAARDAQKVKEAASFNAATNASPAKPPVATRPKPALAAAPSGSQTKTADQLFNEAWDSDDDD